MDNFAVETVEKGKVICLKLSGHLTEGSDLSRILLEKFNEIEIDLESITNVSSKGVRTWMLWVSGLTKARKYSLYNCPKIFVNMVNLVPAMLPAWMDVKSIGVPYFCTQCAHSFSKILQLKGSATNFKVAETCPCEKCGGLAELDAVPEKYFKFLEGRL
jgi:hypothetical protein